jgi:hypothetical protein
MKRAYRILALLILITMLSPIAMIETVFAAPSEPPATDLHKTQDFFLGSFSPPEVTAVPNEPFDVTFSIRPTINAPGTTIRFIMPADLVTLASGDVLWQADLKKDEKLTLSLSMITQGEIEAYVRADVEASTSGNNYQSSYYLHVATSKAIIASGSTEPGILRSASLEYVSTTSNPESSRATENPQGPISAGTIEVKGRFLYLDENGGYSSAQYMWVRLRDNNDAGWSASGWTNATGYFDFVVANSAGGRSPILDLIAEGKWDWKGTDNNGAQYWWSTGVLAYNVADGWVWTNYGLSAGNNNDILQAGDAVYAETQMIYDWTGWMRSKVTIRWPSGTWAHSHGDYIDLPLKTTGGWDHVTVQHEEGHCIMWALYGSWPPGSGPDPHYIWSESSQGFALTEGWAEFMMCAVDNNANNWVDYYNGHGGNMETNDWFNCQTNGNMDGAIIEGSIASILWDIFDPANIAGDNDHMAWGFDEIFTVMQNDKPQNILDFWNDWAARWPDNSTSKGPLCSIYYQYGIDEDWFNPWGTVIINGGATYTNSRTVTLTLDGKDWGVGVKYMRFSEDYGVTWGSWYNYATTFTYTITSPNDGWKYIDVQYGDLWWLSAAGTIYDGIGLDTAPPTGSIIVESGNPTYTVTTSVTLYLTYSDTYSGVYQVRYGNSGGTWSEWEAPAATKAWTLISGDGTKTVWYQIKDYAGSVSTMYNDAIVLDTTLPTGSIVVGSGNPAYTTTPSVTLYLTYTDAMSGVYQVHYGNTGDPWSAWEAPSATKAWTLPAGDGPKYVWYQIKDYAGLISNQFYDGIILDTTNPNGSIVVGLGNPPTTPTPIVTLYLAYSDATSGVYQVRYGNSGGSWSAWEAPSATKAWTLTAGNGTKTVWYQVMDKAGLVSPMYSDTITLNFSVPTFGIWTDKNTYKIGEKMKVYVRVINPGNAIPVRATIRLQLTNGNYYGPLLDMTVTLPAGFDSGNVLWNQFTLPTVPLGNYKWIAELRNPTTGALISQYIWYWQVTS